MTKHEYICELAKTVRAKSDCSKRQVGAIFVNEDYEILATGYNAPPRGFSHCDRKFVPSVGFVDEGCTCGNPCTRNIHAEQNAIAQAAKRGTALKDSILYCTYTPCVDCSRLLINIQIRHVVVLEKDKDEAGLNTLQQAGIPVLFKEEGDKVSMYESR